MGDGTVAPEIALQDRDKKLIKLADFKGKVVLVDFWATWCEPCLREIPNIKENYEQFRDKGFEVVGINMNTVLSDYDDFFSAQELPWPSVMSKVVLEGKTDEESNFGSLPMAEKAVSCTVVQKASIS